MLPGERVIELMFHSNADVRESAIDYFTYTTDPTPLASRDVFRVVDRWGVEPAAQLFWDYRLLPRSEECIHRLHGLAREGTIPRSVRWAIASLDPETTLGWLRAADGSTLSDGVRELISFREEIRGRDPRELWRMHEDMFLAEDPDELWTPPSPRYDALVAELHESPREVGALAVATLEYWSRLWCDDGRPSHEEESAYAWLARSSHPDALPLLIRATFGRERRLSDRAEGALKACGDIAFEPVVRAYRSRKDGGNPYSIASFRVPQVEDVLVDLLLRETDDQERTEIGVALCCLFPTTGLQHVLDVVLGGKWLPEVEPLDHSLVVAATAAEWDAPGLDAVREEIARQDAELRAEEGSGIHERVE